MGMGIVVIKKRFVGRDFTNTYGVVTQPLVLPQFPLSYDDIDALQPPEGLTDANTLHTNEAFAGQTSLLASLVSFERTIYNQEVQLVSVLVTDGKTQPLLENISREYPLGFLGSRPNPNGGPMALNTAVRVIKSPYRGRGRKGSMQYRAIVGRNDTRPDGGDGVEFLSSGERDLWRGIVFNAILSSQLFRWFGEGSQTVGTVPNFASVGIPHYFTRHNNLASPLTWGTIRAMTPVGTFVVDSLMSRQTGKGKTRRNNP